MDEAYIFIIYSYFLRRDCSLPMAHFMCLFRKMISTSTLSSMGFPLTLFFLFVLFPLPVYFLLFIKEFIECLVEGISGCVFTDWLCGDLIFLLKKPSFIQHTGRPRCILRLQVRSKAAFHNSKCPSTCSLSDRWEALHLSDTIDQPAQHLPGLDPWRLQHWLQNLVLFVYLGSSMSLMSAGFYSFTFQF